MGLHICLFGGAKGDFIWPAPSPLARNPIRDGSVGTWKISPLSNLRKCPRRSAVEATERNEYRVKEKRQDRSKSPKVIANDGCGAGREEGAPDLWLHRVEGTAVAIYQLTKSGWRRY